MAVELSLENGGGERGSEMDLEESTELRKEEVANGPQECPHQEVLPDGFSNFKGKT